MTRLLYGIKFLLLAIAPWGLVVSPAIARPVINLPSLPAYQINRLARDLTHSPSEDFFRQGRLQLEQEIQLARKRQQLTAEILKVNPDLRKSEEMMPNHEVQDNRQNR